MDLSIVIVNWNTKDLLRDCLASLPQACLDLAWEVFVVDNQSADDSVAMITAEFPHVRLIESGANCGFSKGNNLALRQADATYVLLLNPDTVCPPHSLTRLVKFASGKQQVGAVGPRLTTASGDPTITYGFFPRTSFHWLGFADPLRWLPLGALKNRVVYIPQRTETSQVVEYIAGACFLIPKESLTQVGLLDEAFFMYFEETDWCFRAKNLGLDIWYCAEAEVVHLEGQAAGTVSQFSIVQLQKSYRIYADKHFSRSKAREFRIAQFCEYSLKALLRSLVPFRREKNMALARNYWTRATLQLKAKIEITPP